MDIIDYLSMQFCKTDFIDTIIMLFGIDELLNMVHYGVVIMDDISVTLNVQ